MASYGRNTLLAEQQPIEQTGIDFIRVNPENHAQIFIYFVIDPADLVSALTAADIDVTCRGATSLIDIPVILNVFENQTDAQGRVRQALAVTFLSGTSFENQILRVRDLTGERIDLFSAQSEFSFKQACPSVFDCVCADDTDKGVVVDFPVDYLARDFSSYMDAFGAYSAARYPNWEMNMTADQAVMIGEVIAALGDEFALIQDRYLHETQFDTLRERRSFGQLARMFGYKLRPETPATGFVVLRHYDGDARPNPLPGSNMVLVTAGSELHGFGDGDVVVPFDIGASLADILAGNQYPTNARWTDIPVHVPLPDCPNLRSGAREIWVEGDDLFNPNIRTGTKILLETRPSDASQPVRRIIVTLDQAPERDVDQLQSNTPITRLHWGAGDALAHDFDLAHGFVSASLVPVISGRTYVEDFTIGPNSDGLPTAIEREGSLSAEDCTRAVIYRYALTATVNDGMAWQVDNESPSWERQYLPAVALEQLDDNGIVLRDWQVSDDKLALTAIDETVTIEAGHWGPVFEYRDGNIKKWHSDYIGDDGNCIRFGDGEFGLTPAYETQFRVTYRTAWSTMANLGAHAIRIISDPDQISAGSPVLPAAIMDARNPLAFDNAQVAENLEIAKLSLPYAGRSRAHRAVLNADFKRLVEARDDVQTVIASSRWTGCWMANFVAVDALDQLDLDQEVVNDIANYIDEIRLVGRPAYVQDTQLRPIDLKIAICHDPRIAFGDIVEAIVHGLAGDHIDALFHPNRFSFGSTIYRAALEARIAAQIGVTSIQAIEYRWRGERDFELFTVAKLLSAPDQIPVLKHDATRPNLGTIQVFDGAIKAEEGGS